MAAVIKVSKVPIPNPIPMEWYTKFDVGGAAESKCK